jgi:hypothetical protein
VNSFHFVSGNVRMSPERRTEVSISALRGAATLKKLRGALLVSTWFAD